MKQLQLLARRSAVVAAASVSLGLIASLASLGCSEVDSAPDGTLNDSGGGSGGSAGGAAGSTSGGTGGTKPGLAEGGNGPNAGSAGTGGSSNALCGTLNEKATAKELYLYMMVDRSESMRGAKWDAVESGLQAFLEDANSEGIHVALNFFPQDKAASCDGTQFKDPRVDYGVLPDNATALTQTILGELLSTNGTPTYTALGGAVLAAMEKAKEVPDQVSAVLLVSDGAPQGNPTTCASGTLAVHEVDVIADVAARGRTQTPPVTTYVVAIEGLPKSFADKIAVQGGSDQSITVGLANAADAFAQALAQIRGQAVPCEYEIPESVGTEYIDFNEVNVLYTAKDDTVPTGLTFSDDCETHNGWHYDNPDDPKQIIICPDRCAEIQADLRADVTIELGCEQIIPL